MRHLANRKHNLNSVINDIAPIVFFLFNKSKYNIFDNIKINTAFVFFWLSRETMMTKIGQVVFEKIAGQTESIPHSLTHAQTR